MRGLLDTHTFMWADSDPTKLSSRAAAFILDPSNSIFLSVASVWEMVIKADLGKLTFTEPVAEILRRQQTNGIAILPIELSHVLALETFPRPHKDPFDRLLAAQAYADNLTLITADPIFAHYPVTVLW